MAKCPFAIQRILPANATQARIVPTAVVGHSNAGMSGDLYGWWCTNPDGLESHFQIDWYGTLYQYMDTEVRADANMAANQFGVSYETANSPTVQAALNAGDQAGARRLFEVDRWSPQQVRTIIRLNKWLLDTHPTIRRGLCLDARNGLGLHDMFPSWTTPGHACPGGARKTQFLHDILPAVLDGGNTEQDVLEMNQAELEVLVAQTVAKVLRSEGVSGIAQSVAAALRSEGVTSGVAAIRQKVGA